jgi:hypothetical protein
MLSLEAIAARCDSLAFFVSSLLRQRRQLFSPSPRQIYNSGFPADKDKERLRFLDKPVGGW